MDENSDSIARSAIRFVTLIIKVVAVYLDAITKLFTKPTKKSIRGQNVLITGAGHGLGREIAFKFAQLGTNLVLVDINEKNNELVKIELLTKYKKDSLKVLTYLVDIRDEKEVEKLAEDVKRQLGSIDILVNNAGIVQCLPFLKLSSNLVERTFQVNVLSHIWTIKHFLPDMIEKKRGHIVAISSIAGLIGGKYLSDYCASKYAVVGLMDSLKKELHDGGANQNIHLTTVCPSSITTGMFHRFTTRFSWLLPVLNADQVAQSAVEAVLTNKTLIVVPPIANFFLKLSSIIPYEANNLVQEYLDYGVKPHSD